MNVKHWEIRVGGIVQGVGMRPFVYTTALRHKLRGSVQNTPEGVFINVEGDEKVLERFVKSLRENLPPLARIDDLQIKPSELVGFESFTIVASGKRGSGTVAVSPDIAVCKQCLAEMNDPQNRRYRYVFINCTDCGPRYSITKTVPYDRPNTSMKKFEMCEECRVEYEDPANRRYHAQPISCYNCGPRLSYLENEKKLEGEQALTNCLEALKIGKIVAVKGLGGFHLMCDATNEKSVRLLRERKRRPSKPFAVMFPTIEAIRDAATVSDAEAKLIDSKERPVVLVRSRLNSIAPSVAPGIDRLGAFLPYTPLHYRIFESIDFPLVATSANLSDEPIIRTAEELHAKLANVIDAVLTHDRDILNACDDSVMQMLGDHPLMLRLARGFAPYTITLPFHLEKKILAVGANQKNAVALAFENKIILSPHIGDLGSLEAFDYFERTLETFKAFYDFEPDVIVCDKHPGYETTKWAHRMKNEKLKMENGGGKSSIEIIEVQHHYAHLLACMAEYNIDEKVLGFTFDGTGYGDKVHPKGIRCTANGEVRDQGETPVERDQLGVGALGYEGSIWGGEVFLGDSSSYERVFSLKSFRLLGGEKAVREPRRVALGLLFEIYGLDEVLSLDSPTVKAFSEDEIKMLHKAWQKGLNAPLTSSMGRLFDAVASLAGITQQVSYEGESGLLLETAVGSADAKAYGFTLEEGKIDLTAMIETIITGNDSANEIASRFLATLVGIMATIAKLYDKKVILSGGVFQNRTLLEQVRKRFENAGIAFCLPSKFPVNDGSIALGQVWSVLEKGRPVS